MNESGVDLGFDLWEDLEALAKLDNCYTLKSQPLEKVNIGSETVLIMDTPVKVKPDPDMMSMSAPSCSNSYLMRTNFKQQLQKEHIMQMEKRETNGNIKSLLMESNSMSIPNDKPQIPSVSSEVPAGILKVTTKLENPTSYHLKQQQKKQLKEYLNTTQRLLPPALPLDTGNLHQDTFCFNNFRSPSPDVPDSSVASGTSEVDSLLDDFFGRLDTVNEDPNMFGECLPFATTLPTNTGLMDLYAPDLSNDQPYETMSNHVSASCPANVKQEMPTSPCDTTVFAKDRQKKDNHNMIERRRRYNINDRIRELGSLIPKTDNDSKQNKGTILKSSVDYIKRLRKDKERLKYVENQKKGLEDVNKKLTLRVQELELILRASGLATRLPSPNLQSQLKNISGLQLANLLMSGQNQQQQEMPENRTSSPRQPSSSAMEASPISTDDISQLSSDDCQIMEAD